MSVSSLKTCCQMCLLHHIIGDGHGNVAYRNIQQFLLLQFEEGAWGVESLAILERAVKYHGYFLTPGTILALLPNNTKDLCLKECPALDEECLNIAYKRCNYLHTLDITENPLLKLSKVDLFGTCGGPLFKILTTATLEDCSQVQDTHIQTLLTNAPNLQCLNIARCGITDRVFLLDEDKQLAKEACLNLDKSFMNGDHLTYDCRLQHVDVSRCSDFTSTGVRHLCTLCGPTLRSVNFAWTKVECTAFLYLSGMGFPAVVKFFMSNREMTNATMKPLLLQLQTFDTICSDIVRKFTDGGNWQDGENEMGDDIHHFDCEKSGAKTSGDIAVVSSNAMSSPCQSLTAGKTADGASISDCRTESERGNAASRDSLASGPHFEIVCLDDLSHDDRKDGGSDVKEDGGDVVWRTGREGCDCVLISDSNGNVCSGDCCEDSDDSRGTSSENCHNTNIVCDCVCHSLVLNDKEGERNEQNRAILHGNILPPGNKINGDRELELSCVQGKFASSSTDSIHSEGSSISSKPVPTDNKSSITTGSRGKATFFTPDITSITLNATMFHDEVLGLQSFQKFLTTNRNLLSLTIFSGISGNYLDDCVLDLIGSYARGLESLSVQGSDKLTDEGFDAIASSCHNLTSLDLTGVSFVGDVGIIPLVDSLPLTRLKLAETRITGRFMQHLATLPISQQLKEIDLSWCEEMESDSALNEFLSSCPGLEKLMLRECCVSATTLTCIAQHSHHITELSLASNMNLTDSSVHALLLNCPHLEKANLEGLKLITSLPFLPLVSVPEELSKYLEKSRESFDQNSQDGKEEETIKLSDLPCLPQRSSTFSTNLRYVNLTYSDFVEDTHLQQIVTITYGGVQMLDYYGNRVEPSKSSLDSFLTEYMDGRGGRG